MFSCVDNIADAGGADPCHDAGRHRRDADRTDTRRIRSPLVYPRKRGTLLESSRGLSGIDEIKQLFGAKTLTIDTGTDSAAGKLTV
ncbi:hypothetical protein KCP76_20180 [Salmonella enterica subsp. enterica serovar Weltevreden]|nr:hypothetical protein KCP76_20180 [Salmonella enterica subsp. enterica serovar Weltevreden]